MELLGDSITIRRIETGELEDPSPVMISSKTLAIPAKPTLRFDQWWLRLVWLHRTFVVLLLLSAPFFLMQLGQYPHSWYDEGLNTNAIQTFSTTGLYGLRDADGVRLSDPAIQTGLPILLPLALIDHTIGSDLWLMRLPIALTGLLGLVIMYALAYRLYGRLAGLLTVGLLLVLPGESTANFIQLSRQVMGEVPTIALIATGLYLLLRAEERPRTWVLIGLCWGLAICLKSQALLVLSLTLSVWIVYSLLRRRHGLRYLTILLVMAAVYGVDMLWRQAMAGGALDSNMAVLRDGALIHIIPFRVLLNLQETGVLVRLGFVVVVVAAVLVLRWRSHWLKSHNPRQEEVERFLLLFVLFWAGWFALVSIGWRRYAFIGIVFTLPLVAAILSRLLTRWPVRGWLQFGLVVMVTGVALFEHRAMLRNPQHDDYQALLSVLHHEIPSDARILTWEWAVGYESAQRYIYPPTSTVNAVTRAAFLRQPVAVGFDPLAGCPTYVLLGSMELDRQVFEAALDSADPMPLFSQGLYQLYAIPESRLPAACR